ncbi:MAG TPA: hypothetical protein VGY54_16650 [Polyangiaceae bacterium]|nr:hypothetical protein [Polyangiaceae bacterium]
MNDTKGLTYDSDAAANFAHVTTGIDVASVAKFMLAKDRYELGLGILPDDIDLDGATATTIRAMHPDLFPADYVKRRYLSFPLQRAFIERDSGLNGEIIARLLDADDAYMRKQGIID